MKLPNSEVSMCKSCFCKHFEKKVFKTIAKYKLIQDGDHVGVAVSGGKDSTAVLYLINKFAKKHPSVKVTGLAVDEGIKGYRDESLNSLKKFCENEKIELHIVSYKEAFGEELDEIVKRFPRPCSICGVFRRYLLNTNARKLKCDKLATGHNLDDEAQSILMNQFRSNMKVSARLGPITGVLKNKDFIPRIKPLYFLSEKEVASYAFLKGFVEKYNECPHGGKSYRGEVRDFLYEFEEKFPGTKQNLIVSFLEILPLLKANQDYKGSLNECVTCGEPCSQEKCQACQYVEKVIKKQ